MAAKMERPDSTGSATTGAGRAMSPSTPSLPSRPNTTEPQVSPRSGALAKTMAKPRSMLARLAARGNSRREQQGLKEAEAYRAGHGYGKGFGPCKPASASPCETALLSGLTEWQLPTSEAPLAEILLQNDKVELGEKYNMRISSRFQPLVAKTAHYHFPLPTSEQNRRYSNVRHKHPPEGVPSLEPPKDKKDPTSLSKSSERQTPLLTKLRQPVQEGMARLRPGVAYSVSRLEEWFLLLDTSRSGEDDMQWVRAMLEELGAGGGASMTWPEFVDFFRQTGLLLEYSTRDELNQSDLGETNIEDFLRRQAEELQLDQERFFSEQRRGARIFPSSPERSERRSSRGCEQGCLGNFREVIFPVDTQKLSEEALKQDDLCMEPPSVPSVGNEKIVTAKLQITARLSPEGPPAPNGFVAEPQKISWHRRVSASQPLTLRSGPMNACAPWKDNVDDFAAVYEPLSKDGAFIPFRPRAPEDMQEPLTLERSLVRYVPVAPPRVRRLVSAVRSREALKQREMDRQVLPFADAKNVEDEYHEKCLDDAGPGYAVEIKQDVDTEAEDSEVSTAEVFNDARPTFRDYSRQAPDGCVHLIVPSKGPLYSHDEPPDFLQLPEPIKQRTAGAARVAAAARVWAAASAHSHPHGRQEQLPATARGVPSPQHAAIAEELNFRGPGPMPQFGTSARPSSPQADPGRQSQVETRQAVAGPAVLALRRMRNQMSALAEGRLPWHFSRDRPNEEAHGAEHVPHPPQQPPTGQRRPLLPNLSRVVGSAAGTSAAPAQNQGAAADGLQMQSLVPAPPSQPKPASNSANSRFWRRPWPRMNIMGTLGWGGSGGSGGSGSGSSSNGASSSQAPASSGSASSSAGPTLQAGEQSRPGTQATNSVPPGQRHAVQDPTPSSGSSAMASPP
eukprot:s1897_g13.t1